MLVKFSTLAGGVFIEVEASDSCGYLPHARCFRFDAEGRAEYATHSDLCMHGAHGARWYGHQFREADFTFA